MKLTKHWRKTWAPFAVLLALSILLAACAPNRSGEAGAGRAIQVRGSDTMVNLAQAWASDFTAKNPDIVIAVTGGGSGVGIESLLNGTTDIADASREIKSEEVAAALEAGIHPVEFRVGLDGIAVVVNPNNPIGELSIDQLSDIYTQRKTNWKDFGWRDAPIVVLSRESNSGTHQFFKEEVVRKGNPDSKDQFAPGVLLMPSSQGIADEVRRNPNAIGYYGIGYLSPEEKPVALVPKSGVVAVPPTINTVLNGSYPLARPLYMYTNGRPTGPIEKFMSYVLSDEGQNTVAEIGFVPLRGTTVADGKELRK